MGERQGSAFSISGLIALFILFLPSIYSMASSDQLYGAPDLVVTDLSIIPSNDGYEGTLKIKNLGLSSTIDVGVVVLDLGDGSMNVSNVVVTFPLLPLGPGKEFTKEFKWVPESAGTHVITAVVDTDDVEREKSEGNNVRSITVSFPFIGSVTSTRDGDPDPDVFGEYLSGIENRIELDIQFDDIEDPSLIRTYATIVGEFIEYGTRVSGSHFKATFDAGSLPVGNHTLLINSTYGGHPLSSGSFIVRIVPPPIWYGDLERGYSFFNKDLSSYVLSGKVNIFPCRVPTFSDAISEVEDMVLNGDDGEIYLSGYILLDGTTTITATADIPIDGPQYPKFRFTSSQTGKMFIPSAYDRFTLEISGSSPLQLDLSVLTLGRKVMVEGVYGDELWLPIPGLTMSGDILTNSELTIGEDGHIAPVRSSARIDITGHTSDIISVPLPGYDDPRFIISLNASWSCDVQGIGPNWSGSGDLDVETSLFVNDIGLESLHRTDEWSLNPQGVGTDMAYSPEGSTGRLELSVKEGHTTHLIYRDDDGESEVYRNNTYKSHPDLEYLWDGRPLVVWSEAGYMEGFADRAASLRLYSKIGDQNGSFPNDPVRISTNSSFDQYPSLSSDRTGQRMALGFIRDMDGDPYTLEDKEVMVSFFEKDSWMAPEMVTNDSIVDLTPDLWFDPSGVLHLVWISDGGIARYSRWVDGDGWEPPSTVISEGGLVIEEISFAEGDLEEPYLLLAVSGPGTPYRLMVKGPGATSSEVSIIGSSDQYIGSSSLSKGHDGSFDALWWSWDPLGGDLYGSTNIGDPVSGLWTNPLRLTDDDGFELSPSISRREDSTFDLGYLKVPHVKGNISLMGSPAFNVQNLSWGGDVVSFSVSDPKATPGTMVIATAFVEYRGLTSSGMVRVDLYRVLRDRDTGGLSQELWGSEIVDFHRLSQVEQVVFTVPVKEFQLGFTAVTVPKISGMPAHTSQRFIGLSALPDLEIISMEPFKGDPTSSHSTVSVSIRNWGSVPAGSWTLKIFSSRASAPLQFENGSFEPLFLRERKVDRQLNSTVIDIPSDSTLNLEMNISLLPGVNHIWVGIEGPSWLPAPESRDHKTILSIPILKLTRGQLPNVEKIGPPIQMRSFVQNLGPWPLNVTYLLDQDFSSIGLFPSPPEYSIDLVGSLYGEDTAFFNSSSIGDLDVDEISTLNWSIGPVGKAGRLDMMMVLRGSPVDRPDPICNFHMLLTSDPEIMVETVEQTMVGDRFTGDLDVHIRNPNQSRVEVVHLTLYNGFPSDNVVISETIVLGMAPGEKRIVTMDLPLEKGLYVLAVTAEAFFEPPEGTKEKWQVTDTFIGDLSVKEPGPIGQVVNSEVDMKEVTRAGIITVSTIMFVLMIASFFFKREQKDNEKE